jgi:hypothetical protein
VYVGVATKELGLTYTKNSKELASMFMRYYWRNNKYKEKPPFFFAPYDPMTFFFLC